MSYVITTYDWVPDMAVGYVRDLRIRWACNEAGQPYRLETFALRDKPAALFATQPFGQVPALRDGDLTIFESGAILLYLGDRHPELMPADARGRAETQQWLVAALNTIKPGVMALTIARLFDKDEAAAARALPRLHERLHQLEAVLKDRDHIAAGRFTLADIMMSDVLRLLSDRGDLAEHPVLADYVARMTARPGFQRAHAAQLAHFKDAA